MIYLDAGIVIRFVEGTTKVRLPIEICLGTIGVEVTRVERAIMGLIPAPFVPVWSRVSPSTLRRPCRLYHLCRLFLLPLPRGLFRARISY
jgi:hypothetical protein